jgi:hypothetical protein
VAILTTRVQSPDEDDWAKLKRLTRYIRSTIYMTLILRANSLSIIKWWVDASFAMHDNPGEYTRIAYEDTTFELQDINLYVQGWRLNVLTASDVAIEAATSMSYNFTTQKNGHRNEKVVQGSIGNALCCEVKATIWRVRHHRVHGAKCTAPIAEYYRDIRCTAIKAKDVTAVLGCAMTMNYTKTGITATEISVHSLRAGGAIFMLCGKIDFDSIQMMGRWHSDAMMRYLHIQAQPIINKYAAKMYNRGTYTFLPDETVPIIDNYGDE